LRQSLGIPVGATLLVYLGLLAPYQGTEHLLRTVSLLVDSWPSVHLLLMGFPFVEHYRQRAADLGIGSRVTFTGPVPYEDAPAHLALGQIAVAPKLSATEGSGKLLPYMAAALPVAAFATPVQREYLGDLGEYAQPGDADDLARAIAVLLADPVSAGERGMALRRVAEDCFTWEAAAGRIESVYEGLLAKTGPVV
jgi:glycosyltransferase involved in cell wall biosynthesis